MDSWKLLRKFDTKAEAQMFAQMLEGHGIRTKVKGDDVGGQYLMLPSMSGGITLLVPEESLEQATELLNSGE